MSRIDFCPEDPHQVEVWVVVYLQECNGRQVEIHSDFIYEYDEAFRCLRIKQKQDNTAKLVRLI